MTKKNKRIRSINIALRKVRGQEEKSVTAIIDMMRKRTDKKTDYEIGKNI